VASASKDGGAVMGSTRERASPNSKHICNGTLIVEIPPPQIDDFVCDEEAAGFRNADVYRL
jgi:hypothetical protein